MRVYFFVAGLILLFFGWNAPNHYPPWTTFHGEVSAAVGVLLLFAGVVAQAARGSKTTSRGSWTVPIPRAALVWALISLIPIVQVLSGQLVFKGDGILAFLYAGGVAIALYVGRLWASQVGTDGALRALCIAVVFSGLGALAVALGQWLRLPAPGWWAMELISSRPYGNLAQPNQFGLLMVMSIVALTVLYEDMSIRSRKVLHLALTSFGSGLVVSQSRSSIVALVAIIVVWTWSRSRVSTRLRTSDVLIPLALGALAHYSVASIEEALFLRGAATRAMLEDPVRARIWSNFMVAVFQHPWLGYGFGQGVMALSEVGPLVAPGRNTIYAHNVAIDLMVWFGIPLGIFLFVALLAWMAGWLKWESTPTMAQRHWVFAFWLALLVQSLLEFPFAHAFFLLPCALLAGVVSLDPLSIHPDAEPRANWYAIAFGAVSAFLFFAVVRDYLTLENEFRLNRFDRANFAGRPISESTRRPWVLDQLGALNATARIKVRASMPPTEIEELRVVARRFHILSNRIDYAKALALNGRLAEAERELLLVKSVYHPVVFQRIRAEWDLWLREHSLAQTQPRNAARV